MISQKTRLRMRIGFYKGSWIHYTKLMETDFRGIFASMLLKKKPDYVYAKFWIEVGKMINDLTEAECSELNMRMDCYQIDERTSR